jgi:hypothetical protein
MIEYDFGPKSGDFRYYGLRGNLHVVQYLRAAGYNVMPLRTDGSKSPKIEWAKYQQRERVPQELIDKHFVHSAEPSGIGVICGSSSGYLEILDFDAPHLFLPWCRKVAAELGGGFVRRLVVVQTPTGGWHVYYRCMGLESNQKLAQDATGKAQIETRGQGGQAVMPGSPDWTHLTRRPYRLFQGRFHEVPMIGAENHRKVMFEAAMSFDQGPPKRERTRTTDWVRDEYGTEGFGQGTRPGDEFNERATWDEILEPKGWTFLKETGDVSYWQRPDKPGEGPSASVGFCRNEHGKPLMKIFSTNARPLEAGECYDKFAAFTHLYHGGDFEAAAKTLSERGFGRLGLNRDEETVNTFFMEYYQ